jgi:hypothetical protein
MHTFISLITILVASAATVAAGRAPLAAAAATITPAPVPAPVPNPNPPAANNNNNNNNNNNHHHLDARQQRQQQSPTTPTPLPSCASSLTALLSGLPPPTPTALSSWALSSAPIQLILHAIASNYAFPSLLSPDTTTTEEAIDIAALCTLAASAGPTAPPDLADEYAAYLDQVQNWRFVVEGDAYALAKRCGFEVGLGLELLMATEAAMCTSGLRESVVPWATGTGAGRVEGNDAGVSRGRGRGWVVGMGVVGVVWGWVVL